MSMSASEAHTSRNVWAAWRQIGLSNAPGFIIRNAELDPPGCLQSHPAGVLVSIKVQPRASRNEIGMPLGSLLCVRVTAPPVDSAANEAVLKLLARTLGIGRNRLELLRGATSRHKLVRVRAMTVEEVSWRLAKP